MRARSCTRRMLLAAAGATFAVSALVACTPTTAPELFGGSQPENELQSSAEMQNAALIEEAEALLAEVADAEWAPPLSGNVAARCSLEDEVEAYRFYGSWFSSSQAMVPSEADTARQASDELTAWLETQGWEDLEAIEFTTEAVDVNAFGVSGTKLDTGISLMQVIYYYEGDIGVAFPHVVVDIDSVCLPADTGGK